jgi:parvulin-like peptidyl-prolyl isomerase
MLAQSYYNSYAQSLTYDDAALRAAEAGKEAEYNSYSYNYYIVNVEDYLHNHSEQEASHEHTAEEKAAALTTAEADAKSLTEQTYADAAAFDKAIASLPAHDSSDKSTLCEDYAYSSITADFQAWVTDSARKAGDMTYIAKKTTTTDENGTETTEITGYYVVYFTGSNDNNLPLVNVRHILVAYEGGNTDSYGNTVYSTEEKLNAEIEARKLLQNWEKGEKTEEAFAALANQHSDDGDGTTGGLYTDVYPGQMVPQFEEWCFAEGRTAGDTGIVNTTYGSHVMFYSGDSETTYRDFLIREAKRSADVEAWYNEQIAKNPITKKSTKYVATDLILSSGY